MERTATMMCLTLSALADNAISLRAAKSFEAVEGKSL